MKYLVANKLLLFGTLAVVCFAYCGEKTTSDPIESYKNWAGELPPKNVKVIHQGSVYYEDTLAGKVFMLPLYLPVFDADKEFKVLESKLAGLESWRLMDAVEDHFEKEIGKAIAAKKDFAFETNFTSEYPLQVPKMFQQAGVEDCYSTDDF